MDTHYTVFWQRVHIAFDGHQRCPRLCRTSITDYGKLGLRAGVSAIICKALPDRRSNPQELIDKIIAAKNFLAGYASVRQLNYGLTDMSWHNITSVPEDSVVDYEQNVLANSAVLPAIEGIVFSPSFSHIFAGGYAAGYYSYKWAEVLEADAFSSLRREVFQ